MEHYSFCQSALYIHIFLGNCFLNTCIEYTDNGNQTTFMDQGPNFTYLEENHYKGESITIPIFVPLKENAATSSACP